MLPRFWTNSALYCYIINSECDKCKIAYELETLPEQCKMKKTIAKLIKEYGTPDLYLDY